MCAASGRPFVGAGRQPTSGAALETHPAPLCPQDVIYVEEISHCAAGVRWLRHLHRVAHETDWELAGEQQGDGATSAPQQPQPEQRQQQLAQQQAPAQRAEGDGRGSRLPSAASLPTWAAEARRHDAVEEWFHSLVRAHFYGALKPPFNEAARVQAGFGPEW